jgi:hypothetical protein
VLGGAVGIALLSTLAASASTSYLRLHAAITPALMQHAAVHGYTTAYWTATAIFTAGALLSALLCLAARLRAAGMVARDALCEPAVSRVSGQWPAPAGRP